MLSLFPELLSFSIIGVFVLRVVVGFFFVTLGIELLRTLLRNPMIGSLGIYVGYVFAAAQIVVGGFLVAGLYTQGAAIAGMVVSFLSLQLGLGRGKSRAAKQVQFLLFVICLSLLSFGAGAFAVDLPI